MLQNMDYIYEVWKERSFSRAAKNLYISQSSLSQTIRHAEKRIGMEIFDRSAHPIKLTEFGELYIRSVEEIYGLVHRLENYVSDTNHLKSGHLAIGAGNFFALHLLPPVIAAFKNAHANIRVSLREGRTVDLLEELAKGNIDLLVSNGSLDTKLYNKTVLFTEHMVLSVPKRFFSFPPQPKSLLSSDAFSDLQTFLHTPPVNLQNFSDIPFILLSPGNDARIRAEKMLSAANLHPIILLEPSQTSTAYAMSQSGIGATIIDDALVRTLGNTKNVYIYRLPDTYGTREVAVYTKKNGYMTRSMHAFIKLLQKMVHPQ